VRPRVSAAHRAAYAGDPQWRSAASERAGVRLIAAIRRRYRQPRNRHYPRGPIVRPVPERPLLLTGPPAVGKSSVARLLADQFPPCAVVEVDDLRRMVVAGEAAPWRPDEGARQTELAARNACLLMSSFKPAGFSVVASDVLLADAGAVYKAGNLRPLIVHITATLTATEQRAATRRESSTCRRRSSGVCTARSAVRCTPTCRSMRRTSRWTPSPHPYVSRTSGRSRCLPQRSTGTSHALAAPLPDAVCSR